MKRASIMVLLAACSGPDGTPEMPTTGSYHHYVTSELLLPTSAELQREYGLNVDGDKANKPDNQLGNVFVALTSNSDANLQGELDGAIAGGTIVLLHSVRADALPRDKSVSWQVYVGADGATPAFDGTDQFEVDSLASEPVIGTTNNGAFAPAVPGRIAIELAISATQPSIQLDLIGAKVEARIDHKGCTGKLGGAVTQTDLDTVLLPNVVGMMNAAIARDPGCPSACEEGTSGALIVEVFDKDMSGAITLEELQQNALIQTLLAPDLDLLDAAGEFAPDGERDSISLGLGFSCVPAQFVAPGES